MTDSRLFTHGRLAKSKNDSSGDTEPMPSFYRRLVVRISGQDAVSLNVGSTLPAHATSMGKILLAQLPPESVRDLCGSEQIKKFTTRTVTSVVALLAELVLARKREYALCDGELEVGLRSVASPIRVRQGIVVAALNVSTASARTTCERMLKEFVPHLMRTADALSRRLGYSDDAK